MAYSDFTLDDLERKFGIKNNKGKLFENISLIQPSQRLKEDLELAAELPLRSEKAKSESIVLPILIELRRRNNKYFTIYSGETLNGDELSGLKGECDFILAKDVNSYTMNYPIMQVVEAKKNDIEEGIKQCAAQLLGAKKFNENKGVQLEKLYGCATTGDDWVFLTLTHEVCVDARKYYLTDIEELLGIFQSIIDYYKSII
jgi:hypothetical protein